uniref:Leucine rich repeat containing 26 n=1 Tax=Ovis aries TaxID=9940 RepID=A0AC11CH96_SHEEP
MRSPSFPSWGPPPPPPLQLLLLLLPWPVWTQAPAAAASWGTPGALGCPEACVCAPGGQANCSGRALPAVPGGLNRRVRVLLLNHNRVHALPPGAFVDAGALLRLDLRENGLRWVHARAFWGLGALEQLDLSANQLEGLLPGTFAPLRALRALSLAENRLARLEPAALGALPLLRALSLQDNDLPALPSGLLAGLPALNTLRLRGNPWTCGCALRPLCAWLRGHPRHAPGAVLAHADAKARAEEELARGHQVALLRGLELQHRRVPDEGVQLAAGRGGVTGATLPRGPGSPRAFLLPAGDPPSVPSPWLPHGRDTECGCGRPQPVQPSLHSRPARPALTRRARPGWLR